MTSDEAHLVVRRILGWWPTPELTREAAAGWVDELTSPVLAITPDEALTYLRRTSHAGQVHRPRPGELIAGVQAERRAARRIMDTSRMLAAARDGAVSPERASQWCRALRRVAARECDLADAQRAEGLVPA